MSTARHESIARQVSDEPLNPAQREVIEILGARRDLRPQFDDELRHHLRAQLERQLAPLLADLPADEAVFVSKRKLALLHGCEARYLGDGEFAWSVPAAKGVVAHKAIETSVHWRRELLPMVLVDEALGRLEEGTDDFARWLQALREVERAELRADANDRLAKFLECWPPLKPQWRPALEARIRCDLLNERLTLQGKVDLQLGRAEGTTAGKVIVDFKTGRVAAGHLEDLRFYALIETLRVGTPPMRVASYYLDQGRFVAEDVTVAHLESTVGRVVAGVEKMIELDTRARAPRTSAGPACRWCTLLAGCTDGQRYVEGDQSSDDLDEW